MPKRVVWFRKNLKHKIRWRSWPSPKVPDQLQSDSLYIFLRPVKHFIKASGSFTAILIFLQSLELYFLRKFTERRAKNEVFLCSTKFLAEPVYNICCGSVFSGYKHFGSKRLAN